MSQCGTTLAVVAVLDQAPFARATLHTTAGSLKRPLAMYHNCWATTLFVGQTPCAAAARPCDCQAVPALHHHQKATAAAALLLLLPLWLWRQRGKCCCCGWCRCCIPPTKTSPSPTPETFSPGPLHSSPNGGAAPCCCRPQPAPPIHPITRWRCCCAWSPGTWCPRRSHAAARCAPCAQSPARLAGRGGGGDARSRCSERWWWCCV